MFNCTTHFLLPPPPKGLRKISMRRTPWSWTGCWWSLQLWRWGWPCLQRWGWGRGRRGALCSCHRGTGSFRTCLRFPPSAPLSELSLWTPVDLCRIDPRRPHHRLRARSTRRCRSPASPCRCRPGTWRSCRSRCSGWRWARSCSGSSGWWCTSSSRWPSTRWQWPRRHSRLRSRRRSCQEQSRLCSCTQSWSDRSWQGFDNLLSNCSFKPVGVGARGGCACIVWELDNAKKTKDE